MIPNSFTFDHCGPMAHTAEDCAILLNAIAGHDVRDRSSVERPVEDFCAHLRNDLKGVCIGVVRHFYERDVPVNPELAAASEEALRVMRGLATEGRTMLVVTHEMEFAREVASHAVFLHQGLIEEEGKPREVLTRPQSERLRQFLSGGLK